MGNLFSWLDSYLNKEENKGLKVYHLFIFGFIGLWLLRKTFSFMMWKARNIKNRRNAREMIEERNSKKFEFKPVDAEITKILKVADCTRLKEELDKGTFTSVDLVNYYGQRCYTIGRELCLSTEELFDEALEKAKECDEKR